MTTITVIHPGFELMTPEEQIRDYPRQCEAAARTCYKSEKYIGEGSADKLIRKLLRMKPAPHESVVEHCSVTVRIVCDRACSHQLVRHRIAAYSQESQRFCDYAGPKGEDLGLQVICPPSIGGITPGTYQRPPHGWLNEQTGWSATLWEWMEGIADAYDLYQLLRERKVPSEDARSVLPNATKTEVVTTFNMRQWRHVFRMRALNSHAQWQIRGIMLGILEKLNELCPVFFEDLEPEDKA